MTAAFLYMKITNGLGLEYDNKEWNIARILWQPVMAQMVLVSYTLHFVRIHNLTPQENISVRSINHMQHHKSIIYDRSLLYQLYYIILYCRICCLVLSFMCVCVCVCVYNIHTAHHTTLVMTKITWCYSLRAIRRNLAAKAGERL